MMNIASPPQFEKRSQYGHVKIIFILGRTGLLSKNHYPSPVLYKTKRINIDSINYIEP